MLKIRTEKNFFFNKFVRKEVLHRQTALGQFAEAYQYKE